MSESLIASLQKRIDDLTGENATLKTEAKDRRIAGKKLKEQLDALTKERDDAAKDRDTFKAKAESAPSDLQKLLDEANGKLAARDHSDAFKGVAEFKAKVKDDKGQDVEKTFTFNAGVKVEDVWQKAQYKAEGDLPDAAQVTEHLGKALAAAPYLFQEKPATGTNAAGAAQQPITVGRGSAGPGGGKGVVTPQPGVQTQVETGYGSRPAGRIA